MSRTLGLNLLASVPVFFVIFWLLSLRHDYETPLLSIAAVSLLCGGASLILRSRFGRGAAITRDEAIGIALPTAGAWVVIGAIDLLGSRHSPWTLVAGSASLVGYAVMSWTWRKKAAK